MFSPFGSGRQSSSSPPPPPYAEIDPALSAQMNQSRHTYGNIQVSDGGQVTFGDRVVGPGEDFWDEPNGDNSSSTTGGPSIHIGNVYTSTSRPPVRPEPTPRYNGRTVVFKMLDNGIKIEGSESASERALVPEHAGKEVEFGGRLTIMVDPCLDGQFASLISADFTAIGLTFNRVNNVVLVHLLGTESHIELGSDSPPAKFEKFVVERKDEVVTVRYL